MFPSRARALSVLAFVLLAALPAHAADPDREIAYEQSEVSPSINNPTAGEHIEGRIAFLKAELMITPQQEALWKDVADAMRADVRDMNQAVAKAGNEERHKENAIQYLQNRTIFAQLRAEGEARFLAAIKPLYASLSAQQKQSADVLLAPDGNE